MIFKRLLIFLFAFLNSGILHAADDRVVHANTLSMEIGAYKTTVTPGALTGNTSFSFPPTNGTANYVMRSNGSGVVTWVDAITTLVASDASHNGYLSSTDWSIFNNKQATGSYITALIGDVSASGPGSVSATVNSIGGSTASAVNAATVLANAATPSNTASTIVRRDASGDYSVHALTAASITGMSTPLTATQGGTGVSSTATFPSSGVVVTEAASETLTNKTISGASNTISNVSLTTGVTGTLPLANGGTGQATKTPAFDALSPMSAAGDLIYGGVSGTGTRLPAGSSTQLLHSGTTPSYSAVSLTADVSGLLPGTNGGTGVSSTATFPTTGVVVTEAASETLTNKTISGASNTLTVRAASDITGQLAIANGGTGQATKAAGFDALSPMSAAGDIVYGGVSGTGTRLAAGSATQVLHSGTTPSYSAVSLSADVTGTLAATNGGTGVSSTATFPSSGVVVTEAASETLTNKTLTSPAINTPNLDGGTASATSRVVVSKETNTNLTALARKQAAIYYDTTNNTVVYDNGSALGTLASTTAYNPAASGGTSGIVDGVNGLKGFSDGSTAAAGYLGQRISSFNGQSVSSGSNTSIANVVLTAGTWSIGYVMIASSGTAISDVQAWISTNSNGTTGRVFGDNWLNITSAGTTFTLTCTDWLVDISGSTTYYLTVVITGTSPSATGRITAVRIR